MPAPIPREKKQPALPPSLSANCLSCAECCVVIGATSIIGNNVKLYQGVTLGAKSFPLDADGKPIKGIPRHPILEDNVIVYSNATILGRITIGRDATVGGNIWVTENVPAGARIVQTKAKK